jgi:fatty acid desaturase
MGFVQSYAQATLTHKEGRRIWLAMLDDVTRQQLMRPALPLVLFKLAALSLLLGIGLWLCWTSNSLPVVIGAYAAVALLLAQFAFVGHDAGHGAISGRAGVDRVLGQVSMTLVTGLAFDEWIARHRAHHRHCQDEARDPDMAVACVVSLTDGSKREKGPLGRFMTRHQGSHVWALSLFFGHSQRHLSQMQSKGLDLAVLAAHFALWFGLPCLLLEVPFGRALLAYVIPLTLLGPYLAAIFWVNHIGMPLVDGLERLSFFERQVVTSRTIVNPPACDWLFGGLNRQIEHHLFPQVPSMRLAAVQAIVRRHFARQGIPYHGVSWRSAAASVAAHFRAVARAP